MVEDIIKAVNHSFIYVSKKDIDQMLIDCKGRLLACSQRCSKFEAFFDCKDLSENQLIQLMDICEETNEVKGKCKLKPYKKYFAFEIREDKKMK